MTNDKIDELLLSLDDSITSYTDNACRMALEVSSLRERLRAIVAQWAAGQSQWRDVETDPPVEWLEVLAYRPGPNTNYFLAQRFTHSSGNIHWELNRRVDPSATPPTKWMLLPKAPS